MTGDIARASATPAGGVGARLDFMGVARWSLSLLAACGLLAAAAAAATIWLLVTDPVTLADAASQTVETTNPAPLVQAIGAAILDALRGLFKYL